MKSGENMIHQHFKELASTQSYLTEHYHELKLNDKNILISCDNQTNGHGRQGKPWQCTKNAITCSFSYKLNETPTLTPLQVGYWLCRFLGEKYQVNLGLKWPNDLLNQDGHKVSGIICQKIDDEFAVVGIGVNLGASSWDPSIEFKTKPASVVPELNLGPDEISEATTQLYEYLLDNQNKPFDLELWNNLCLHTNQFIRIEDNSKSVTGTFKGIGNLGQALVEQDDLSIQEVYTGTVYFD
jgi:BirA family biotin operon repressor/biotin-[acetyl-CoA-carboxylase] ligase